MFSVIQFSYLNHYTYTLRKNTDWKMEYRLYIVTVRIFKTRKYYSA